MSRGDVPDWYVKYLRRRYRLFLEYVRRWRYWVRRIAEVIRERVDPRAEVIVFGSVVKGRATGGSDVDVLVVTERARELRPHEVAGIVEEELDLPEDHPFEFHLTTPEGFETRWRRFLDEYERVG
ncbi:nucleotidyltransferase domain-containing protein [Methanopyrus kandleri]|uniref:protein adenylyltransferase n=1 Tax=Methanopyrus kandleri (strain AV19 / DSM 6324 / JCM 9639 / NBRC 100938) TaxID=190192 RepID=Q8TVV3_METKA|nr:nucleotidyltransferase domain-containing protein [Methanopyrus kandleri]AAM02498.1 Predicted nucleotidyltransferase of the DNA polymerase beta family [Methanopyrus kandleri AV19]